MTKPETDRSRRVRQRTAEIRDAIQAMDLICTGSINRRTKVCGKSYCRCAQDPQVRHGPYHEWAVYEDRRLTHRSVTADQAEALGRAIANYRELERLIAEWVKESASEILAMRDKT